MVVFQNILFVAMSSMNFSAVEPVCQQYKDLEHEVLVERECRNVAEEFATKVRWAVCLILI